MKMSDTAFGLFVYLFIWTVVRADGTGSDFTQKDIGTTALIGTTQSSGTEGITSGGGVCGGRWIVAPFLDTSSLTVQQPPLSELIAGVDPLCVPYTGGNGNVPCIPRGIIAKINVDFSGAKIRGAISCTNCPTQGKGCKTKAFRLKLGHSSSKSSSSHPSVLELCVLCLSPSPTYSTN